MDPDNRRPVDFTARDAMLCELDAAAPGSAAATPAVDETGAARMLLTSRALRLRREHPELFGDYTPLETTGALAGHALGFDRGGAATVVTRFPATLAAEGGFTDETVALAPGTWQDVLTHREFTAAQDAPVALAELLDTYPVAILRRKDS